MVGETRSQDPQDCGLPPLHMGGNGSDVQVPNSCQLCVAAKAREA